MRAGVDLMREGGRRWWRCGWHLWSHRRTDVDDRGCQWSAVSPLDLFPDPYHDLALVFVRVLGLALALVFVRVLGLALVCEGTSLGTPQLPRSSRQRRGDRARSPLYTRPAGEGGGRGDQIDRGGQIYMCQGGR